MRNPAGTVSGKAIGAAIELHQQIDVDADALSTQEPLNRLTSVQQMQRVLHRHSERKGARQIDEWLWTIVGQRQNDVVRSQQCLYECDSQCHVGDACVVVAQHETQIALLIDARKDFEPARQLRHEIDEVGADKEKKQ